ncbi:MAG: hypothetical protein KA807_15430 [Prolixibacteraceae bacterium]|nr:hypothetical protein [Prolixibacteraceae bacterium]
MNAEDFWKVIGLYNQETWPHQILLIALIIYALIKSYHAKQYCLPKLILGIANIFIGIVFFLVYGTEPIQHYFAAPLFITIGGLFLRESVKFKNDIVRQPNKTEWILIVLLLLYPIVSLLLGNTYPKMVVYIMPCPLVSLSIIVYSFYSPKNILLLGLLAIWGLTGIKSFFFNAYEDIILLLCGIYCVWVIIREVKNKKIGIHLTDNH